MAKSTAKDVAAIAGVDPSTVSRVLRGCTTDHRYDPQTVSRIRKAAEQLGYVPSPTARALRTGVTHRVGLLVSDISNPFFAELAGRIERRLREKQYRLIVTSTDESPDQQRAHLNDLVDHGVDGLILSPSGVDGMEHAIDARIPLITVDRRAEGIDLSHVGLDDSLAGRMLGQRLRAAGYRAVGIVMPSPQSDPGADARFKGVAGALGKERIAWVHRASITVPQDQVARQCIKILKTSDKSVDAIIGLHNTGTLAALDAISELGWNIPKQVGLAGIDDFAAARHLRPSVTVVAQPIEDIAREAADLLLKQIKSPSHSTTVTLLKPRLIERQSLCSDRRTL